MNLARSPFTPSPASRLLDLRVKRRGREREREREKGIPTLLSLSDTLLDHGEFEREISWRRAFKNDRKSKRLAPSEDQECIHFWTVLFCDVS